MIGRPLREPLPYLAASLCREKDDFVASPGNWPDGSQDATRLGSDWRRHALPVSGSRNFIDVAYGFKEAAEAVFESVPVRSPDPLFLPLAYLWRHHFELLLKANISLWGRATGSPLPPFGGKGGLGHDLRALFDQFEALTSDHVSDKDLTDAAAARAALETFLELEPHHDASRYPVGTDGRPYERPERVDLSELHSAAQAVSALLGAAYDQADAWLDAMPDASDLF